MPSAIAATARDTIITAAGRAEVLSPVFGESLLPELPDVVVLALVVEAEVVEVAVLEEVEEPVSEVVEGVVTVGSEVVTTASEVVATVSVVVSAVVSVVVGTVVSVVVVLVSKMSPAVDTAVVVSQTSVI